MGVLTTYYRLNISDDYNVPSPDVLNLGGGTPYIPAGSVVGIVLNILVAFIVLGYVVYWRKQDRSTRSIDDDAEDNTRDGGGGGTRAKGTVDQMQPEEDSEGFEMQDKLADGVEAGNDKMVTLADDYPLESAKSKQDGIDPASIPMIDGSAPAPIGGASDQQVVPGSSDASVSPRTPVIILSNLLQGMPATSPMPAIRSLEGEDGRGSEIEEWVPRPFDPRAFAQEHPPSGSDPHIVYVDQPSTIEPRPVPSLSHGPESEEAPPLDLLPEANDEGINGTVLAVLNMTILSAQSDSMCSR